MKNLTCIALTVLIVGCASLHPVTERLPEKAADACAKYQELRPVVLFVRAAILQYIAIFPADIRNALMRINAFLPVIDDSGKLVCEVSDTLNPVEHVP